MPLPTGVSNNMEKLADDKPDYEKFMQLREEESSGFISGEDSNLVITNAIVKESSSI